MSSPAPEDPAELDLTTVAEVNVLLGRTDEEDAPDPAVETVVRAVCSLVPRWRVKPAGGWDDATRYGAALLAARLYRRKDSPGGMAEFGTEGAAYVSGNWPDVALFLGIGTYSVGRPG